MSVSRGALVELSPVRRRSGARATLAALRPRQWTKNLLLFAGIVFAAKLGDGPRWAEAAAAFATYCAASSAGYLVNDVCDAPHDRLHPVKRMRPIASGELSAIGALRLAGLLAAVAFGLVLPLGAGAVLLLAGFLALQAAYSFGLKRVVLADVLAIAALFVVRATAGAQAVEVRISPWLLVCTALLALFLGLAKRRGELVLVGSDATPGRPVLSGYSFALVDTLAASVAAATLAAYAAYTLTAHSPAMIATIPFVGFGIVRYLLLVHRDELGEEPEQVLVSDRPILLAVCGWAVTAALILAAT